MNFITRISIANLAKVNLFPLVSSSFIRSLSVSTALRCKAPENPEETDAKTEEVLDPAIDRTRFIPVETSIRYLKSAAYKTTYGEEPVWVQYRRNFKGQFPPSKTRKTCIRAGKISTGSPCPICRDEYLILDHNNIELLKQFISEHTGEVSVKVNSGLPKCLQMFSSPSGYKLLKDWIVPEKASPVACCNRQGQGSWTHHIRRAIQRLLRILRVQQAVIEINKKSIKTIVDAHFLSSVVA